jgi:hypothetical protein
VPGILKAVREIPATGSVNRLTCNALPNTK